MNTAHEITPSPHDWHESDRAFLRSLKDHTRRQLHTLGARLHREDAPTWKRIAVEREIERRVQARGAA